MDNKRKGFQGLKLNTKFTLVIILITAIPIGILTGVLFYNMEQNTVREQNGYMEYKMKQARETIHTGIDSINMSTQFFMSDSDMNEVLCRAVSGESISTSELIDFQSTDVKNLERLVYNNPMLYAVRIYSTTDSVQEMMPILYRSRRMQNMEWSHQSDVTGWKYGYYDEAFSAQTGKNEQIMSLVTPITHYKYGTIGYVEASEYMSTMFPCLYDNLENEYSCFIDHDGNYYFGGQDGSKYERTLKRLFETYEPSDTDIYYQNKFGENLLITILPIEEYEGYLIQVKDITQSINSVYHSRNWFIVIAILILVILSFVISRIVNTMLKQLYIIISNMHKVQKGDLNARIEVKSDDEMGELGTQLNRMLDQVQKLMKENIDREVLAKNSEIRALQNQINAHFIYNVLESIKMMAEIDEEYEISDAITALGKLLRYSMRWVSGNVSLREELDYIKNYLVLINLRYDFSVILSLNLNEAMLNQELPKMSLQPIVENAVLHGIEPTAEDATIYIKGWYEENDCVIEITDAGSGMTDEQFEELQLRMRDAVEPKGGSGKSNGIGLKNVHDRIQMAFGKGYGLSFATKLGCYTKVAVRLPRKESKQNENIINR